MSELPPKKKPSSGSTRVRSHTRTTQSGRRVKVRSHDRTITAWRQAGVAWAGTAASGTTALAMVLEFGFTLVSGIFMVLTALIGSLAVLATAKATAPQRRMHAKTRRPRARSKAKRRRS
ncbi:hypothetical protein [Actinoallomurus sp. NPDC052274]|uniref:hypothetical protein n=1 Tax=Actinoallomurus sp. NPDC052274 TaxID=3155420 RepID=UPI00344258BC